MILLQDKKINLFAWLLIAFSVILLNLGLALHRSEALYYFFFFFLGLGVLYLLFFKKKLLFYSIVFLIPLSIPNKIAGGSVVSFPSELLVALLGGFYIFRNLMETRIEKKVLYHPLTLLLLLDILWMLVTSIFSSIPDYSFKRTVIRMIYIAVYYFLAAEILSDRKNMWKIFVIFGLGLIYPVITSMINHAVIGFAAKGSYQMTHPFFADHTIYGACLAFLTPILFLIARNRRKFQIQQQYGMWLWLLFAFIFVALFLSYSRAAWLSVIAIAAFAVLIYFRIRFYVLVISLGVLAGIVLLNFDNISDFARRSDSRSNSEQISEHLQSVSNIQTDASNTERINRWKCAARMFYDRPLFGFGPGTYQYNYGKYQVRAEMTRISTYSGNRGHAHSEYMTYISEEGLPGLLIFLLIVLASVYTGLRVIYKSKDPADRSMALAVLLALITYYIHGIFNAFLDLDKMAMPVFAGLAILVQLHNRMNHQEALGIIGHDDIQINNDDAE